jgi:hypothetical protein
VSREKTTRTAHKLLAALGAGADPDEVATLFSVDVQFDIPGDVGALPWIGRKTGRGAVADFIRDTRRMIERVRFDVQDILANDEQAVILGELASKVSATGRIIDSAFALILTVANDEIIHFRMLEDSFAVSRAARP